MKTGRPKTKESKRSFRLCSESNRAISKMAKRWGWTATAVVERAIIRAVADPKFGPEVLK